MEIRIESTETLTTRLILLIAVNVGILISQRNANETFANFPDLSIHRETDILNRPFIKMFQGQSLGDFKLSDTLEFLKQGLGKFGPKDTTLYTKLDNTAYNERRLYC